MTILGKLLHILGKLSEDFGKLVHILNWKLVSRTSKQVSRNLGPLWQLGVWNRTKNTLGNLEVSGLCRRRFGSQRLRLLDFVGIL